MAHHTQTEIQIHTDTCIHTEIQIPFSYFVIFGLFGMHAKDTNFIFGTHTHTQIQKHIETCTHTHTLPF